MVFDARVINNIQYYYAKETAGEPLAQHYVALLSATSASFSLVIVHVAGHRVGDYIPLKEERPTDPGPPMGPTRFAGDRCATLGPASGPSSPPLP
jgi:hypothetical protein